VKPIPIKKKKKHESHLQRFTENTESFIKNPTQGKTNPM